jgi:hypothetical protein
VTDIFISLWCVDEVSLKSALLEDLSEKAAASRELELPEKEALPELRDAPAAEPPRPLTATAALDDLLALPRARELSLLLDLALTSFCSSELACTLF